MGALWGGFKEQTVEEQAYYNARARCTNPNNRNYKNYGGRGIEFRFTSFEQFHAEIGGRPTGKTLDRQNNDGHYEPGNVRWASRSEQARNKRRPTEATNLKRSCSLMGRKFSDDTKKQMSKSAKVRPHPKHSPETISKMREARLAYWASRRTECTK
jgi:hypothetical protein